MDDKQLMEDLLMNTKGVCEVFMHGTIESATQNVHQAFDTSLHDVLDMQNQIYNKMSGKGWYTSTAAEQNQIQQVKQKLQQAVHSK